jgi:DNA-binding NtrC family response regulator
MSDSCPVRILIVDNEPEIRELCASIGRGLGLHCVVAATAPEALQRTESDCPEMVLADLPLGSSSGLVLLAEIKRRWPRTQVALMSACGSIESAVEAMQLGACDFVVKPFEGEKLRLILQRMVEKVREAKQQSLAYEEQVRLVVPASLLAAPCMDLEELERLTVQRVFELVNGDKAQARKLLGISRATLYRKIKRYGIQARQDVPVKKARDERERMILLSQS